MGVAHARLSLCSAATAAPTGNRRHRAPPASDPRPLAGKNIGPRLPCTSGNAPWAPRASQCRAGGPVLPSFGSPTLFPSSRVHTWATRKSEGRRVTVRPTGLREILGPAERQHSDARPLLVDRQERASFDVVTVSFESRDDDARSAL